MNTKIILVIALLISIRTNAQITFQKTYAGGGYTQAHDVQQTTDGGYIIAGYAEVLGAGIRDVYLIKTDVSGDTLWTKTFGGTGYDEGFAVEQTFDNGFIITGNTTSFGGGPYEVYLIKTDAMGNAQWSKTFGGNMAGTGNDVHQTIDGGYIITGETISAIGIHDVLLIKTDASGDTLWTKKLGGPGDDYGYSVAASIGGGYLVAANYSTAGEYIIKTNAGGDTLWTRAYVADGPTHLNLGYSIQQTADTGYIVAGVAYGASGMESFLNKINSNGISQWSKIYSGGSHLYTTCVKQTTDGGYILSGWSQSFPIGTYKSLLIKTDAVGDTLWTKSYGGGSSLSSVQQAADGGFVLLAADNFNIYLIKTDSIGNSGCSQSGAWPVVTTPSLTASVPQPVISQGGIENNPATLINYGGTTITLCLQCNLSVNFTGLPDTVCENGTPSNLFGTPSGGNFSGAGVDGSSFSPAAASLGLHEIVYTYSLSAECTGSDTLSVFVKDCGSSVNNLNDEFSLVIYPNPADEFLLIKNSFQGNKNLTVKFYDISGREIFASIIKTSNQKLETRNLENGIYFCQLKSKDKIFNQKFIVQH